jgi:hypothetical protein
MCYFQVYVLSRVVEIECQYDQLGKSINRFQAGNTFAAKKAVSNTWYQALTPAPPAVLFSIDHNS